MGLGFAKVVPRFSKVKNGPCSVRLSAEVGAKLGLAPETYPVWVFDWFYFSDAMAALFIQDVMGEAFEDALGGSTQRGDDGAPEWQGGALAGLMPFAVVGMTYAAKGAGELPADGQCDAILFLDLKNGVDNDCPVLAWPNRPGVELVKIADKVAALKLKKG
jgi:hypothetical protein